MVEELGRAVAPGPFVPTVIASAVLAAAGDDAAQAALLPGLADGSTVGAVALGGSVTVADGTASGDAGVVLGGGLADAAARRRPATTSPSSTVGDGVTVETPPNLDPTRRSARVTLDGAPGDGARRRPPGAGRPGPRDPRPPRPSASPASAPSMAAEYAKEREQFGRPIAMFQAVKHHCANMLVATELATSAVWDAARAAVDRRRPAHLHRRGGRHARRRRPPTCAPTSTSRCTAASASPGSTTPTSTCAGPPPCSRSSTPDEAAADLTDLTRRGVAASKAVELPPEAEPIRDEVRAFAETHQGPRRPTSSAPS